MVADETPVGKASLELPADAVLRAKPAHPFVSRGGVKLGAALEHFGFDPAGRICLDVGSSTGGFTDVAARARRRSASTRSMSGATSCIASCAPAARSWSLESTDIRTLVASRLAPPPALVVIDVSFISLKLVLPAALALAQPPARLIALIKPQFEAGRAHVKKGIVRDAGIHAAVGAEIWRARSRRSAGTSLGRMDSPILGRDGNREFLIGAQRD